MSKAKNILTILRHYELRSNRRISGIVLSFLLITSINSKAQSNSPTDSTVLIINSPTHYDPIRHKSACIIGIDYKISNCMRLSCQSLLV